MRIGGALATVVGGLMGLACCALASAGDRLAWFDLEGRLADRPAPMAFLQAEPEPTLFDVIAGVHRAAEDKDVKALVLRLREPAFGLTQAEELGRALAAARKQGKRVTLFTENYGVGEILLGSYADEVVMQSGGIASFPGMLMQEMYLADTLAWLGMKADFVQIGDYKGAKETLANSAPSPEWDACVENLLNGLFDSMVSQMREGRGMSAEEVDTALEEGWMADAPAAIRARLVDRAMDRLELNDALAEAHGDDYETDLGFATARGGAGLDMSNPFVMLKALTEPPDRTPKTDTIAVVHIDGVIVDGESEPASPLSGRGSVGSLTIRKALAEIEHEDLIRGVVVRIDSPGGSASASESIWQGLRRVAEHKPVWVSVGSMAASGGYYIAVAGDRIFVNPSSIVGSIGVVGGKIVLAGTMEKLHVNVVTRARGQSAELMSTQREWLPTERAKVEGRMRAVYDQFVDRVRAGRKDIDIAATAEGRLFAGRQALTNGMADELGGLHESVRSLAASLKLTGYEVLDYPAPKSLAETLEDIAGSFGFAGASVSALDLGASAGRALLGDSAWERVGESMRGAMELRREPVILMSPRTLLGP